MAKMLFWGHIGNVGHPMEEMHHLSPVRSQEQAKVFSDNGYDVTMAVFHKKDVKTINPALRRTHIFDLKADDYDIFFLNFRLAINQLYNYANGLEARHSRIFENREKQFQELLNHPNMLIQLDAPRSFVTDGNQVEEKKLVTHFKHIGISTEQGVKNWNKVNKTENHFLCHAATISFRPDKKEDPMPNTGRKRILYLGRLNDASEVSTLEKIEALATRLPEYDFIVVSCKLKDRVSGRMITPMLTEPNDITVKKTELAKKQFKAKNIIYMPGPRYIDTFNYMYHADLGLSFAVRHGQDACSCKVYEYLGSGCPIVLEDAVPEAWLLDKIDCGLKAQTHNFDDMALKIKEALEKRYDREAIKSYILSNHTYEQRIRDYIVRLEK